MSEKKLNLWQKLVEIRKQVVYIKAAAQSYNFKYADSEAVLGKIVPLMNDLGLLLKSEVVSVSSQVWTGAKKNEMLYTVQTRMTWINADNPEEREECLWGGTGCNNEEKGFGSALTYNERYFMLKFFNIATGQDDPDNYKNTTRNHQEATTSPVAATNGTKPATAANINPDTIKMWDEDIAKQENLRALADDYSGVEMLALPELSDFPDEIQKMMVKESRTDAEKKKLIVAYINAIAPKPEKAPRILQALSVWKDNNGNYSMMNNLDEVEKLNKKARLVFLYRAAKGAVIKVAQDTANKE